MRHNPVTPFTSFYGCPIAIDKEHRQVEPANFAKGIVARANLFMSEHFGIRLSEAQRNLFQVWNTTYPPDAFEMSWAKQVAAIEGYENAYIAAHRPKS